MKKLLVFHPTIAPYRIDIFNDLAKNFDTTFYFDFRFQVFCDYEKIERQLTFRPHYLSNQSRNNRKRLNRGYLKALRSHNPDIVLVGEYGLSAIIALLYRFLFGKKYKIVSICDDSFDMVNSNNDFSKFHKIARRFIVPRIDEVILPDSRAANWYVSKYHKGIFFPIISDEERVREDYERLLPASKTIAEEHGLTEKKVFLFVGRLVGLKNVETIIRAFAKLDQEENALIIIGDGELMTSLKHLSEQLSANVLFMGRLENVSLNVWYNIADVLVLASFQEAFGAVTNEALMAGCRCIVSEKAGSSCLIKNDVNGFVFNPHNVEQLSELMQRASDTITDKDDYVSLRQNQMLLAYKEMYETLHNRLNNL